jgi:hypothetical protein
MKSRSKTLPHDAEVDWLSKGGAEMSKKSERAARVVPVELFINAAGTPKNIRRRVEKIMDAHPKATQGEIYELAFQDRELVGAILTMAISNALMEILQNKD